MHGIAQDKRELLRLEPINSRSTRQTHTTTTWGIHTLMFGVSNSSNNSSISNNNVELRNTTNTTSVICLICRPPVSITPLQLAGRVRRRHRLAIDRISALFQFDKLVHPRYRPDPRQGSRRPRGRSQSPRDVPACRRRRARRTRLRTACPAWRRTRRPR